MTIRHRLVVLNGVAALALLWTPLAHAQAGDQATVKARPEPATPLASPPEAWPVAPRPPAGAPNVLLVMTDDVGFGSAGTFGGLVPTPRLDAVAKDGARYNRFHTTALCSPTRAALLTGRNPTRVNMGNVLEFATGRKGYTGVIPKSAGTLPQILRDAGYSTAVFGKWHLAPLWETSPIGPFDRWPSGLGFDYAVTFMNGETSQFFPALFEDHQPIAPPTDDPGYILDKDLTDRTIGWIRKQHSLAPEKPFFAYVASGSAHVPHSAPPEWLLKFRGRYNQGWDKAREEIFARQKAQGIIPKSAVLTPRPDSLPAWDSLSPDRQRVAARLMEAYAAMLAFTDHEFGRIVDSLKASGQYDDTLIVFVQGDNGSGAEAGLDGALVEDGPRSGAPETLDYLLKNLDLIGGPQAQNQYPAGWAWATNAPFRYYKGVSSFFGGTRTGLVVSWPGRIRQPDKVRDQFLYVTDIMPTILAAAGVQPPDVRGGEPQMSIDGKSFASTFADPKAAEVRTTQVFSMMQTQGIYHDGWMASTRPVMAPWDLGKKPPPTNVQTIWELHDLRHDYTQSRDLAAANPAKLRELQTLFAAEAARNDIAPGTVPTMAAMASRPSLAKGRQAFTYYSGLERLPEFSAPQIVGRSWEISADIVVPPAGANGVMVAQGGRFGGYSLFLDRGVPMFQYSLVPARTFAVRAPAALAPGAHTITARFAIDKPVPGSGGTLTLSIDDAEAAKGRIDVTHNFVINVYEGLDIGKDTLSPVSEAYTVADSPFTGELKGVRFNLP